MSTRSTAGQSAERLACVRTMSHLAKDAAATPHINTIAVIGRAKQNLGRAVPSGSDIIRQRGLRRRLALRHASTQPEVADLDVAVAVQQQIRGLDVAVQ